MIKPLLYILFFIHTFCVGQEIFNNFYNADGDPRLSFDRGYLLKEVNNHYYVIGDYSESKEAYYGYRDPDGYPTDTTRALLMKVDKTGKIIFNKQIEIGTSCNSYLGIGVFNNNGITLGGGYYTSGSYCGSTHPALPIPPGYPPNEDAVIVQTDYDGNIKWVKILGTKEKNETIFGLQESNNGGYFILYLTRDDYATSLIELDKNGDSVRTISLTYNESYLRPKHLAKTKTGYIVFYEASHLAKTLAIILNKNGDIVESKTIPIYKPGYIFKQTSDEGYAIIQGVSSKNTRVFKIDKDLNLEWTNEYASYSQNLISETSDHNYIIGNRDFSKIDEKGNIIWNRRYFGESNITPFYFHYDGIQTSDGGFLITGYYDGDTYLIKTDCEGNLIWDNACVIPQPAQTPAPSIYPNPFENEITFRLTDIRDGLIQVRITDLLGQIIFQAEPDSNNFSINTSAFSSGVYICSVYLNDKIYRTLKLVKH